MRQSIRRVLVAAAVILPAVVGTGMGAAHARCSASITAAPASGQSPLYTTFTGSCWAPKQQVSLTYQIPGFLPNPIAQPTVDPIGAFTSDWNTSSVHEYTIAASGIDASGNAATASTQVIVMGTATVTLSVSPNPSTQGQPVTLSGSVSDPGEVTPSGTVTYFDNGNIINTKPLDSDGTFSYSTSHLTTGTHTLWAKYNGSTLYSVSESAKITETINT